MTVAAFWPDCSGYRDLMSTERGGEQDPYDPDADPEMLQPERNRPQPDKAEGADDPAETGETGDTA
jgi:hypothetical protein